MPYTLRNLGYEILPNDDSSHSTRVTLDDGGYKDECIVLRAEEIDIELPINIDEWPLIVQAVEKLLADRAPKKEAVQPAVAKEFLEEMDFSKTGTIEVLSDGVHMLDEAFCWSVTPQGHDYWNDRHDGRVELSDADKVLLQSWVDAADYYEKNND